jgi:hypothetical protein
MDIRSAFAATLRHLFLDRDRPGVPAKFDAAERLRKNDGIFVGKMPPWLWGSMWGCGY